MKNRGARVLVGVVVCGCDTKGSRRKGVTIQPHVRPVVVESSNSNEFLHNMIGWLGFEQECSTIALVKPCCRPQDQNQVVQVASRSVVVTTLVDVHHPPSLCNKKHGMEQVCATHQLVSHPSQ